MRRVFIASLVMMLAWIAFPSVVVAQDRTGFWFGVGGGYGSADVSCSDCEPGRESSGVGYVRGGWNLNPQTRIGVEYDIWTKTVAIETGVLGTINLSNVSGTVAYYPSPTAKFFVKGGAGLSLLDTEFSFSGSKVSADLGNGFGVIVGAGYDFRVARRWSVTPAVDFWYGSIGNVKVAGTTLFNDWKQNVIDFTVGITFR